MRKALAFAYDAAGYLAAFFVFGIFVLMIAQTVMRELEMRTGGTENLVVAGDAKDHLIPFAESICVEVDVENKRIRVDLPEGLLDF